MAPLVAVTETNYKPPITNQIQIINDLKVNKLVIFVIDNGVLNHLLLYINAPICILRIANFYTKFIHDLDE